MEPVEEGYNDARFRCDVNRHLHCLICHNVLKDPVQCRNQHLFCTPCISRFLTQSHSCPTCGEDLMPETLVQSPKIIADLLSSLKITCDYVQRGCCQVVELGVLKTHVKNCDFAPVVCSNDGCKLIINRLDKEDHERNHCEYWKRQMDQTASAESDLTCVAVVAATVLAVSAMNAVAKKFSGLFLQKEVGSAPPLGEDDQESKLEDYDFPSDSDDGEEEIEIQASGHSSGLPRSGKLYAAQAASNLPRGGNKSSDTV